MSRRVGQIVALFSLFALIVVVIAYQFYDQQRLRGDVLTGGYLGVAAVCGNATVEEGEQCDDGNGISGDGCSETCQTEVLTAVCGNGTVEIAEQCDDGNALVGDGCSDTCQLETSPGICGNGVIEGAEQCDDGNIISGDGCNKLCVVENKELCGNGILDAGEECDFRDSASGQSCFRNCTLITPVCGNGVIEGEEQCDDENAMPGDGCSDTCQIEAASICGNGRVDVGEQCDDGNTVLGDGCAPSCEMEVLREVCGNGILERDEQCDDGNNVADDGCSDICLIEQNSGVPNESADDPTVADTTSIDTTENFSTVETTSSPQTETTTSDPLFPNIPHSSTLVGGQIVNRYFAIYGEKTVLDGLQVSQHVPNFTTEVRWSPDAINPISVDIDDMNAARTFFIAPSQEVEVSFVLEVKQQDTFVPVAKYVFSVVSPALYAADANKDGVYDFSDLLELLQKWDDYGSDATQILAIILSRYQE